jgi:hypothetical protein
VKRGYLRIWVTESFTWASFMKSMDYMGDEGKINLLISDGIILTGHHLKMLQGKDVFVQRVLTSYQLVRILREQYIEKAILFLYSRVSDEWDLVMIETILESLRIKSSIQGSRIIFNVIGKAGKLKYFMKSAELAMAGIRAEEEKIWEDRQPLQGRL